MRSRLAVLVTVFWATTWGAAGQTPSVLHIKIALVNAAQKPTPIARHALLISDNPSSAAPRLVVTAQDGTVDVRLRPGNYTVESDHPVAFEGKAYEWTQIVDIAAGRDAVLELTAANADVKAVTAATTAGDAPADDDPSSLIAEWQNSVVDLWTPTARGSGFVIGADGLVATSQRVVGASTSIEVQLTASVKVAGSILVSDPVRDISVIWIDPKVVEAVRPIPDGCQASRPSVTNGQKIFTIDGPLRQERGTSSGTVRRVVEHDIESDLTIVPGGAGGPVFAANRLVGITSAFDDNDVRARGSARVVPIADLCDVVATAQAKKNAAAPPSGIHLPVEPSKPFPSDALKDAAMHRLGSLSPYQMSSSDFEIAFITPVMTYGVQYQSEQASRRERGRSARPADVSPNLARTLMDFGTWSEYVADFPPVLLVRVTPKQVEGFWMKFARGAAQTQGVALPPLKHIKSGFLRMRALCGDAEVTPVHPFKIEQRVSETDAVFEGLYVFDPAALGPPCGSVKLVLYSEKEPQKGDTQIVDAKIIQQIWDDFASHRSSR